MSQRVPSCDVDDNTIPTPTKFSLLSTSNFTAHEVPKLVYKGACKKGQPLTPEDSPGRNQTTWDIPRTSGTLESIVNHRIGKNCHKSVTKDALVPCFPKQSTMFGACKKGYSMRVESGAGVVARGPTTHELSGGKDSNVSGSDTYPRELSVTFNSDTMGCPENTCSSGKQCTDTTAIDDRDSVSHRRSQSEAGEEDCKRSGVDRYCESNKRIKASAVHNQSERRRRDKINQRMKELQKLVPNSSKQTDKASMLDEVIQYMKQLQAHLQMMNWMKMYSSIMLPIAMQQQQLKMSMIMTQMGIGMRMSKEMTMNMNNINIPSIPPMLHLPPFMPVASCADQLLGEPPKSVTVDAYSKMAALYNQMYHSPYSTSKK
ncbi:transcription factor UNE10-like isoform X1 [Phaseolus vulgaris]|uniref:BHLH domain-containing protein n=2 Tax=Phaseolus vulgaris TaxID=3885 RepID=V7AML0_PHAVU|nr:hypothetical protein PHAVU_010G070600g [Phaseolus vulgaris]ESW06719.1 hypothetical protein PHAVU_010G070600g [Phaseolus vulgaris]